MKKLQGVIFVLISLSIPLVQACNGDDPEELQSPSLKPSISFSLSSSQESFQSGDIPFRGILAFPLYEDENQKIVNYAKSHSFRFLNQTVIGLGVHLNHIADISNGIPDLDSLFLAEAKRNSVQFLIDQTDFSGFGVTVNLELADNTLWYSYKYYTEDLGIENVDQSNSNFDIYEVIELDTATFIKARLDCNLYNQSGDFLRLESGGVGV